MNVPQDKAVIKLIDGSFFTTWFQSTRDIRPEIRLKFCSGYKNNEKCSSNIKRVTGLEVFSPKQTTAA